MSHLKNVLEIIPKKGFQGFVDYANLHGSSKELEDFLYSAHHPSKWKKYKELVETMDSCRYIEEVLKHMAIFHSFDVRKLNNNGAH